MERTQRKAAIYARSYQIVELPGNTNSLQRQIDRCRAYCQELGYTLAADQIFYEVRQGSNEEDRPELGRIRAAARDGLFEILVIADHTRITRHPIIFARLLEEFHTLGVRIDIVER